jgi:hypothetical protein
MSGCRVAWNTGAVGKPCRCILRPKRKKIKAAAEITITPPMAPPAMAPALEEEPLDLDEVAVGEWVVWNEEGTMAEAAGVLITAPGLASGVSEKEGGSVRQPVTEKKVCSYLRRHAIHLDPRCP